MTLILDTDHLTVIQRETEPAYSRLRARLSAYAEEDVRTTIVSFEEQMRGWLSIATRSKNAEREVAAYQRLYNLLTFFGGIRVVTYDDRAAAKFKTLRPLRSRIGTMDLKITAMALTQDALLLSRNLKDFSRVPDLRVQDWTV